MILEFPNIHGNTEIYMDCLRAICGDTTGKSMIDLGCNLAPHTPLLGFADRMYVDILPRTLDHKDEQKYFKQADVLKIEFFIPVAMPPIDVAIASDVIEHFTKEDGFLLKRKMEDVAYKQVLFTPLGDYMVDTESTDPEGHHSGWHPEDVPGYAIIIFSDYHPTLGVGAFFFWRCENIQQDFERVKSILATKSWYPK